MEEMFGTPVGTRLAEQDAYARAINRLQIQQTMGQLAMQPFEQRQKAAQAEAAETQNKREKAWLDMMQKNAAAKTAQNAVSPPGAPQDQTQALLDETQRMSKLAFDSGFPEEGAKLAEQASLIQSHTATAANNRANEQIHQFNLIKERVEYGLNLLSSATDEASWQRALAQWKSVSGQDSGFEGVPYSKEAVDQASRMLLSAKERADLGIRERTLESQERNRKSEEDERKLREKLIKEQTKVESLRADKLSKEGGPAAKAPARLVKDVTDYISRDFSNVSPEETRILARPIAERADELMRKNTALKESEATAQAYQEALNAGTFKGKHRKGQKTSALPNVERELAEAYGQDYDPKYEYREVEVGGKTVLQRRKKD